MFVLYMIDKHGVESCSKCRKWSNRRSAPRRVRTDKKAVLQGGTADVKACIDQHGRASITKNACEADPASP
jgi:hypothetical protein